MKIERGRLVWIVYGLGVVAILGAVVRYVFVPLWDATVQLPLAAGVIFLAAGVLLDPEQVRQWITRRQARYGSNAALLSVAFIGILVVINVVVYNNPQRIDLTEDKEFSLSSETLLLLSQLEQPVTMRGFYSQERGAAQDQIRPILDEYVRRSGGKISYEFVDPFADPVAAQELGVSRDGSVVVIQGENSHVIDFPSETEITSALVRLANPEKRKIYFLSGHGERELDGTGETGLSQLKSTLEGKNYQLESLNLLSQGSVPDDATVVVVAGTSPTVQQAEVDALAAYVAQGGALVVLTEPIVSPEQTGEDLLLAYIAEQWGIQANDDLVVDLNSSVPFAGISASYDQHPITERMQNLATIYPTARSLTLLEDGGAAGIAHTPIVLTGQNSWGETDLEGLTQEDRLAYDADADAAGPLTLAIASQDPTSSARLVVFGDSDFATNGAFAQIGNGDMIVNSVDWTARLESLISITHRQQTQRQVVPPSRETLVLILIATLVLLPGAVLVLGGYTWWTRRQQA